MSLTSKALDKVSPWGRVLLLVVLVPACLYYIARYGIGRFLLHVVFGPEL